MVERYAAIRAEVKKPAYVGLTPEQLLAALVVRNVPALVPVTPQQITRVLQKRDKWHTIVMWAERVMLTPADAPSAEQPQGSLAWRIVGVCMRMVEAMNRRQDFDLSDAQTLAAVTAGLDALIVVGLLDANDKAAVLALADAFTSIAERDGFPGVTIDEITTELARSDA